MSSVHTRQYQRFLQRLREAREQAGLTQQDVAGKLGWEQSLISKMERGVRRLDVVELSKFARLYKKPARFFLPDFPPE